MRRHGLHRRGRGLRPRAVRDRQGEDGEPDGGEIRLDLGLLIGSQVGDGGKGRVELIKAVEELSGQPVLAARAMAALALPYWPSGPLLDNLAWLERAEATAAESGDAAVQAAVAANRVTTLLSVGDGDGWRQLEQLPRESDDLRILQHSARGVCNAADAAVWLGECARARELLAEAPELVTRSGDVYQNLISEGTALRLDLMTGRWADLAVRARAHVAEAGEMPYIAGDAMLVLGVLTLAKGEWGQAGPWFSAAVGPSEEEAAVPLLAAASGGRVRLALARKDLGAAAREAAGQTAHQGRMGVGSRTGPMGRGGDSPRR